MVAISWRIPLHSALFSQREMLDTLSFLPAKFPRWLLQAFGAIFLWYIGERVNKGEIQGIMRDCYILLAKYPCRLLL